MTKSIGRARKPASEKPVATIAALFKAIESERDNLGRAISLLHCLRVALEHEDNILTGGPYFPDIAQMVLQMVEHSMEALGIAVDGVDLPKTKK